MEDFDLTAVFASFLAESDECLATMEMALLQLEQQPDDPGTIDQLFRAAHTIKGNSSSLGFPELAAFAHEAEDLLDRMRTHELRANGETVTVLLGVVDVVGKWLPRLRLGEENPISADGRDAFEALRAHNQKSSTTGSNGSSAADSSGTAGGSAVSSGAPNTIRVQTSRMDSLLNLTGEVSIAAERVRRRAERLPAAERGPMMELVEDFERLLREVHETVMSCRMVSVGPTFRRHHRSVRDLAAAKGVNVQLVLEGEDVEVDVSVLEALADPLLHMIRNAVDHGIETREVRLAAGKREMGTLTLRAFHERGSIVVQIVDDGDGIRRDRLRQRAEALGMPTATLTDGELLSLIFEPGFSTAENVTETSGRGVGMDVVRRNVERVRGRIQVASREGEGTIITMRLPLTLAVIPGFVVSVAGEMFVIPLGIVDECLARTEQMADLATTAGIMNVRGEAIPFVRLRDYFGFTGPNTGREVVVIVDHYDMRAGFLVDEVIGETQTVIKPLTSMLRNLPGIAGTAVMVNGSVAMVLEPEAIFKEMERSTAA